MRSGDTGRGLFVFFRKHYNGDYSLARSYWINTFLLQGLVSLAGLALLGWLAQDAPARYGAAAALFLVVLGIVLAAWAIRGTWASSSKHVARGGRRGWANAAKVLLILSVVGTVLNLAKDAGALAEYWKVATGWQSGPAVTLQVRADGKSLLLRGGINDGTAEALAQALDAAPSVGTVVLHSAGGWVQQGKRLAEVIRVRKLNTYVEEECSSACTIAFLAGKERAAEPDARIGFHAFRSIGTNETRRKFDEMEATKIYRQAGLSPEFIDQLVKTPPEMMWYPPHGELLAEGVLTRTSLGGETARFASTSMTRGQLLAEFDKLPALKAMAAKYPQQYDAIVQSAWSTMQARRPDAEVMGAVRSELAKVSAALLPQADDATLLDFTVLLAEQTAALGEHHPKLCLELIFPTGKAMNLAALMPQELVQRELALLARMIETSSPQHAVRFSQGETTHLVLEVLSALSDQQMQLIVSPELRARAPADACQAVVAYLGALNRIPAERRARSIRAIYSSK